MKKFFSIGIAAFFAITLLGGAYGGASAQETRSLDREDIVALSKPSVVRVMQRIKGDAVIPALKINLRDRSVEVDASRSSKTIPIDETLSGSGFIVSSDGYVVTNSHVISLQSVKIDVMTNVVLPAMYEDALSLNEEEAQAIFQDQDATFEFSKKVFEYLSKQSVFDVKQDIVVLNPLSEKEKLDELIRDGLPAQVISVNDQFFDDDKDIALIKIDQENLPMLPLGESGDLWVGKSASIFGFPATAELNQRNPLESTFTQGVISALKDSQKKDFKIFQTDAKVSEGSSGGPLVNESGEVVGVITFQSDEFQRASGDNFAFAIPIELVKQVIEDSNVKIITSAYARHFSAGIGFLQNRRCHSALREFEIAGDVNDTFRVDRYLAPYIARCELIISSGQSVDTVESRVIDRIRSANAATKFAFGLGCIFILTMILVIAWLIREVHKEELEIVSLEKRLHEEELVTKKDHRVLRRLARAKKSGKALMDGAMKK